MEKNTTAIFVLYFSKPRKSARSRFLALSERFEGQFTQKSRKTAEVKCQGTFAELWYSVYPFPKSRNMPYLFLGFIPPELPE